MLKSLPGPSKLINVLTSSARPRIVQTSGKLKKTIYNIIKIIMAKLLIEKINYYEW